MIHITYLPLFLHRPSALWAMPLFFLSRPLKKMPVPSRSDAVETGEDAVETSAESVQTSEDAVETDAEAVETGIDAVETDAEANETGAEAVETDEEAVQTGEDVMNMATETGHFPAASPPALAVAPPAPPVAFRAMTRPAGGCTHRMVTATLPCGIAQTQMR
ncbi:MAG: hypothetical protein K9J06_01395 [Flavobacteriales bacterium]|nr:hypothetical protein [Flavobacteriales bacterium]